MIVFLLIMGLTIYQDNHTYESDIIKYQTDKNYILCESPSESCPKATEKLIKQRYEGTETKQKTKINLPLHIKNVFPAAENEVEKIEPVDDMTERGEKAARNTKPGDDKGIENMSIDEIIRPVGEDYIVDPEMPFAIKPTGFYDPAHEGVLMAKLLEQEDASGADRNIIEKLEVHFINDDEGLFPVTSHAEKLINIGEKHRDNSFRITGYGLDEDEAKFLVISVVEILGENLFIEDVRAISDENKRIVIVEVLDEIR
jgi:hypothetical protein